ncbi:MAG: hypothetical protein G01um101438_517 [Parcubacteria group bacterium Gr01-1014_38]|nr:MAG: hypothetical protein G01um101438_517 [Parcubacteria group bacterium Gr01-1014_38]
MEAQMQMLPAAIATGFFLLIVAILCPPKHEYKRNRREEILAAWGFTIWEV